jgi:hypothetical protein
MNALDVFAKDRRNAIAENARHLAQVEGCKAPGEKLGTWKQARKTMFEDLDPSEKARYELRAAEVNERSKLPPDVKVIYKCVMVL